MMRITIGLSALAATAASVVGVSPSPAVAEEGLTHFDLMHAGWTCFSPAPAPDPDFNQLIHCARPHRLEGFLAGEATSMSMLTFDTTTMAVAGPLLGTERFLHKRVYEKQEPDHSLPCPTDPDDTAPFDGQWSDIEPLFGLPYYTCHTFQSPW